MAGELLVYAYDLFKPFDIDPVELNDRIINFVKARKLVPDDYIPKVYTWRPSNNTIKLSIYIMKRTRIVVDIPYNELKTTVWPPAEYIMNEVRKATNEYVEDSGYFEQGHMHIPQPDKPLEITGKKVAYIARDPMAGNLIHQTYGADQLDLAPYVLEFINKYGKENGTMKTAADICFEQELAEIKADYETKIIDLQTERDLKIEALRKRFEHDKMEEEMQEVAWRRKAKLDALVNAGFTKKEAMDMIMEDLRNL